MIPCASRNASGYWPVLVALAALVAVGCATAPKPEPRSAKHEDTRARGPDCRTSALLLSSATHKPHGALFAVASDGLAMVWAEQGERATLRFLVVGGAGAPHSPSVEVVDSTEAITPIEVHLAGPQGYEVAWQEGDKTFARALDLRGRPRADVVVNARAAVGTPAGSRCAPAGGKIRCVAHGDVPFELPGGVTVASERDGAVIGSDAEGLKLFVQSCAKQ